MANDFQSFPSQLAVGEDHRYQFYRLLRSEGQDIPIAPDTNDFVPVIGKVKIKVGKNAIGLDEETDGLELWLKLPELQHGVEVKCETKYWIVTGRIPFDQFESVQSQVFVISLQVTEVVKPLLIATVEDIGLKTPHDSISQEVLDQGGQGVFVGIVDVDGCDFNHDHFKDPDGKTRIQSIWVQGLGMDPQSPQQYGKVFSEDDINQALQQPDPYKALGYSVKKSAHGTHVMDIAAGSGKDRPGVAPKAKIIYVELSSDDRSQHPEKHDFGDSVRVIEAVRYIFDLAGKTPCVVNMSFGKYAGPHDGTTPVELAFDGFLKERPNRAIVVAAGNAYKSKLHQAGCLKNQGESSELQWKMITGDRTSNEMGIWYSGDDEFDFELFAPNKARVAQMSLGQGSGVWDANGKFIAYITHTKNHLDNNDNEIYISVDRSNDFAGGIWVVKLTAKKINSGPKGGIFHAWIERDDACPSQFVIDDFDLSLNSISTSMSTITVGSYDAHNPTSPIFVNSSAGPTRDGRLKPEVSAPGVDVWAADSTTNKGVTPKSGTSMAAPAVTGLVARILGRAYSQGRDLSIDDIRQTVINTCRTLPPDTAPDPKHQYGLGRISAEAITKVFSRL